ncbi:hypothetical protein BH20ACT2_BH20ACT2_21810 [soil metagenome]
MSVSESQRHQLFQWFEQAMGPEKAAVMMDLLPPIGWGDLATKRDVDGLRAELKGEIAGLRGDLKFLDGRMEHGFGRIQKSIYLSMLASNATVVGLVLAVLRLA